VDIILLVLHVCLALSMITLILLQRGKGASAGAVLGGGGSAGSVFGASGSANFLSKTTALLATAFFINSLALAYLASNREGPASVVDTMEQPAGEIVQPKPPVTELDETVPLPEDAPAEIPATAADTETPPPEAPGSSDAPAAPATPAAPEVPE